MTYTDAIQTLTAMKNLAEFYRKRNVGGTIIYGVEIERKCLIDEINALHTAIKALESHAEVVRCEDCRYKDTEDCPATERRMYRNNIGVIKEFLETWCGMEFCSNGKRRAK